MLSFFNDFSKYITDKFSSSIVNLIYFAIGLAIGIIVFCLIVLVVYLISKNKKVVNKTLVPFEINEEYKGIIAGKKATFNELVAHDKYELKSMSTSEKYSDLFKNFGKQIYDMAYDIAKLYYPNSKDPIFEISIDRLVDFIDYIIYRLNFIIDTLLEGKLKPIDFYFKQNTKNQKLSYVFKFIDKKDKGEIEEVKEVVAVIEPPKKKSFFGKVIDKSKEKLNKAKNFATNYVVNKAVDVSIYLIIDELNKLYDELGEDLNKLYSNNVLNFTDKTKRQLKRLAKEEA